MLLFTASHCRYASLPGNINIPRLIVSVRISRKTLVLVYYYIRIQSEVCSGSAHPTELVCTSILSDSMRILTSARYLGSDSARIYASSARIQGSAPKVNELQNRICWRTRRFVGESPVPLDRTIQPNVFSERETFLGAKVYSLKIMRATKSARRDAARVGEVLARVAHEFDPTRRDAMVNSAKLFQLMRHARMMQTAAVLSEYPSDRSKRSSLIPC